VVITKNIIFAICSLLILFAGVYLYEKIEDKIPDTNWLIVGIKIIIALLAFVIYIIIVKFFANIFNITWEYPFL
jgi:hypothetical protein